MTGRLMPLGPVEVRRFFGGHALVLEGVQFAFLFGDRLWLRVDETTRPQFLAAGAEPFSYGSAGGRRVIVSSYFEAPAEVLADPAELLAWSRRAHAAAAQAKKKASRRRKDAGPTR